jgi:hypothetical protein
MHQHYQNENARFLYAHFSGGQRWLFVEVALSNIGGSVGDGGDVMKNLCDEW